MPDYSLNETLTRTLTLERLKWLSDAWMSAKMHNDPASARMIDQERQELKKQFLKVIK